MCCVCVFVFQAEDGIRDLVRSRGLGDVYKRQGLGLTHHRTTVLLLPGLAVFLLWSVPGVWRPRPIWLAWLAALLSPLLLYACLLYTSDAADERSSVDLGGRRIL